MLPFAIWNTLEAGKGKKETVLCALGSSCLKEMWTNALAPFAVGSSCTTERWARPCSGTVRP